MAFFDVVISGNIAGIHPHRFSGGKGKRERYETESPAELVILRRCQCAFEVFPEDEPEEATPDLDEASPEAIEEVALREKLLAIPDKDLRSKLAGRGIIKVGMNNAALVDAIMEHPEIAAELT